MDGAGGRGTGTGGAWVVTVMTVGGGVVVVVVRCVTIRRAARGGGGRWTIRFFFTLVCLTSGGRWGWSTMWTAPPPITAPPAAHAVSFAKAIRTDIVTSSNQAEAQTRRGRRRRPSRPHGRPTWPPCVGLCHYSDQEIPKVQPCSSKPRSALGFAPAGSNPVRTAHAHCYVAIRGSGVEISHLARLSSISRSRRNIIIERVITMKCRSLAADGGTDYRRSRPLGGGPEDTVRSVAPTGPLGEWYGDGV